MIIGNRSCVVENKISICVNIAPRLEAFFIEEWIEHHLKIGVDKIYIYETGAKIKCKGWETKSNSDDNKWAKKPNADYFEDFSTKEIYDKINDVISKFGDSVVLNTYEWKSGQALQRVQMATYKECTQRYKSEWWISIDPDEYIVPKKYNDLKSFFNSDYLKTGKNGKKDCGAIWLSQRVFDERKRNESVRKIFNYGYDLTDHHKCITKHPIKSFKVDTLHRGRCKGTPGIKCPPINEICFHHYRGDPINSISTSHMKALTEMGSIEFDKYDYNMKKYL